MVARTLFLLCWLMVADRSLAGQVKYMLWDSLQLPAYRQCAADFMKKNPGITVRISQAGWGDYWTSISTGFIAEAAPDVFVNHLAKYPEYARNDLLVDLTPYVQRDRLDLSAYPQGLLRIWGRDGRQYGLPKDWDTVALMVNLSLAKKAGVTLDELRTMDWNPQDGGSFERVIRRLSIDSQGRNALSPDFDRRNVAVHGFQIASTGGMAGQTEWSPLAVSNGFSFQDAPWSRQFHYDDPRLAQTLDWLASLPARGLSAPYQNASSLGAGAMFVAGKAAMVPDGSWMVSYYASNARFETAWVPLPQGPRGRASMLNGLADSIWSGSKNKEEAWLWLKYLASADCQRVVAGFGIIFPALDGMAEQSAAVQRQRGVDTSAFLAAAKGNTFLTPIADEAAQIDELMKGAIESVLMGRQKAGPALQQANAKVNALLRPKK